MTSGNTDQTRRRRMAGWTPRDAETTSSESASSPNGTSVQTQPAPSVNKDNTQTAQVAAPARKRRMGQPQSEEPTPTSSPAGTRRRMGGGAPAQEAASNGTTPRTTQRRMAPADTSAATPTPTARRTRMGAAGTSSAEQAAPDLQTSQKSAEAVASPATSTTTETKPPRPAWVKPVAIIASLVVLAVVVVLLARWLRSLEPVQEFLTTYSGHTELPENAPVGLPGWIGWQHFLNMFFMVLIVRTGLQVRTERKPPGHWTPKKNSFFAPKGATPKKVSLSQWLHQSLDVLWVANGLVFIVLLFVTGQWMRIVPMSWDIFPHMLSTMLQYASLDWPLEDGWVHYNAMQVMAYFVTVFIAAPLAILSGIRISTWWPDQNATLNKIYPVEVARAIHFPVMLYFVAFTVVHVFLVFFTGALRNLNHMYTSRDVVDAWGLIIFLVSLVVIAAGWFLTKPMFITPVASKTGKVSK